MRRAIVVCELGRKGSGADIARTSLERASGVARRNPVSTCIEVCYPYLRANSVHPDAFSGMYHGKLARHSKNGTLQYSVGIKAAAHVG